MLQLTIPAQPHEPQGLFSLPLELRRLIFAHVLVEIPKWEKRHAAGCHYMSNDTVTPEQPPFVCLGWNLWPSCPCAKRTGLSLLLASRQIHDEAAPIFWSGNTFWWDCLGRLCEDVRERLRPEYHTLIRHVCIMSHEFVEKDYLWQYERSGSRRAARLKGLYDPYWKTVLKCMTGLRTLELRPEFVSHSAKYVSRLKKRLPQLQRFRFLHLAPVDHAWNSFYYYKVAVDVDPSTLQSDEDCRLRIRDFQTNFVVHCQHAMLSTEHSSIMKMRCDANTRIIRLRDGRDQLFVFLGLPNSYAIRLGRARDRWTAAAQRRKEGKLSVQQEELLKFARDRRAQRLRDARILEEHLEEQRVAERKAEHERREKEARMAEKAKEGKERARVLTEVWRNMEVRLSERKREGRRGA